MNVIEDWDEPVGIETELNANLLQSQPIVRGTTMKLAKRGVCVFSDIFLDEAHAKARLRFFSGMLQKAVSARVEIVPGTPAMLRFMNRMPVPLAAGEIFMLQVEVTDRWNSTFRCYQRVASLFSPALFKRFSLAATGTAIASGPSHDPTALWWSSRSACAIATWRPSVSPFHPRHPAHRRTAATCRGLRQIPAGGSHQKCLDDDTSLGTFRSV